MTGLGIVRIVVGFFLIYHGQEVFHADIMNEYLGWDIFQGSAGPFLAYLGKVSEFVAGISLFLGLFTRIGALIAVGTFSYITFIVGQGQFWYGDQHPFMFALFGFLFLFAGPGAWSVDGLVNRS